MEDSDDNGKKCEQVLREKTTPPKCKNFSIESLLANNDDGNCNNYNGNKSEGFVQICGGAYENSCDNFEKDRLFGNNRRFGDGEELNTEFAQQEQHEDINASDETCSRSYTEGTHF